MRLLAEVQGHVALRALLRLHLVPEELRVAGLHSGGQAGGRTVYAGGLGQHGLDSFRFETTP